MKKFLIYVITSIFFILCIFITIYSKNIAQFANTTGKLETKENPQLQANINFFMEKSKKDHIFGENSFFCTNRLYGYDEKYAYVWLVCSTFFRNREGGAIPVFPLSSPARFEYKSPNFRVIDYKRVVTGATYTQDLKHLFPKEMYEKAKDPPKNLKVPEPNKPDQLEKLPSVDNL